MIPYAKLRARRRVSRSTSAYAASTLISSNCRERETHPRRTRALRKDVPLRGLQRLQRREPTAREQPDGAADATADPLLQQATEAEQPARARRLELQQRAQLRGRTIEHGHVEQPPVLGREVDATELEIARDVL